MTKGRTAASVFCAVGCVVVGWVGAGSVASEDDVDAASARQEVSNAELSVSTDEIWPQTMDATSPPWEVYGFSFGAESADEPAIEVAHDPGTGRSILDTNGDEPARYEIAGMRVYAQIDGGDWEEASDDEAGTRRRMVAFAQPTHVRELLPVGAAPFTTVDEQGRTAGGHRRFVITFDADAYGRVAALERIQWTAQIWGFEQPEYVWTVDVRDDGYIVRWVDVIPGAVFTWNESEPALTFESPLR